MIKWFIFNIMILFFAVLGTTSVQYGTPQYDIAILRIIGSIIILSIPPIIAYSRNLVKRKTIYWLAFCWIIPFSWLIALFMAIFGKPEQIVNCPDVSTNERLDEYEQKLDNEDKPAKKHYNDDNVPNNVIDRAFYKIGHGTVNAVITVKNSRVVRGTISGLFKLLLVIAIFVIIVIMAIVIDSNQSYNYRASAYNNQKTTYSKPVSQVIKTNNQKNRPKDEKLWFEQAAASMK